VASAFLIERGRNAPSFEVLEKISNRLKMPVRDFFDFGKSVSICMSGLGDWEKWLPKFCNLS